MSGRRPKKRGPERPAEAEAPVRTQPVDPHPEIRHPGLERHGRKRQSLLVGAFAGACTATVILVVASGQVGTVVGEPLKLWARWFTGDQLGSERLWGWPLPAWGRLGKVCQFVAGLTVVLDLIGSDRLRAFGSRLRGHSWRQFADKMEGPVMVGTAVILLIPYLFLFLSLIADNGRADLNSLPWWVSPASDAAASFMFVGVGFLALRFVRRRDDRKGRGRIIRYVDRLPLIIVSLVPIALWVALSRGLLLIVNVIARAFDRTRPGHPLRWSAFTLFLVGFHFDLLAS